ncbi:MAG: hypothetical protein COB17_00885 [Sulfurimonas sp.]|nr:MAG: hypothetical protein COB17_00885 [Sulfurimonas sp.]
MKTKSISRIKENITAVEYKKLMNAVRGNENIRANTKSNMLRTFCILFRTGLRLNEIQDLRISNIRQLLEDGTTKAVLSKTKSERRLFITDDFKKELTKLFDLESEDDLNRVITKGSNKNKRTGITDIVFIGMVNRMIQEILGASFSSHCFRRGIISEMGAKSINTKIISKFIGHSSVKTTMGYINPTDTDIVNCLVK